MIRTTLTAIVIAIMWPVLASADTLCDTSHQNCRVLLVQLINHEQERIDIFAWFFKDGRIVAALNRAQKRGVQIRILSNDRWPTSTRGVTLRALRDAGLSVRVKASSGMAHTKAMIFHGQMVVEHGGANFSSFAFVPVVPYRNYTDEIVHFTTDPSIVRSFMTSFDDWWTSSQFRHFGHASNPQRANPPLERDARLQVSSPANPHEFHRRVREAIDAETVGVDAIMYRITDPGIRDALLRAHQRGVRVRILTDPTSMDWRTHPDVERALRAAGIEVKRRVHAGLTHEKLMVLHGQTLAVIGSQNWTVTEYAIEHNLFEDDPATVQWARDHFERKWDSPSEFR